VATRTVITETGTTEVDVDPVDGALLVDADAIDATLGWHLRPEGLCRGDVCRIVPPSLRRDDGRVDLLAVTTILQRPVLVDDEAGAVVIGVSAEERKQALDSLLLPDFTLPDLDGALHASTEWSGRKRLLVAFASW
jgi:hypothetical protein